VRDAPPGFTPGKMQGIVPFGSPNAHNRLQVYSWRTVTIDSTPLLD